MQFHTSLSAVPKVADGVKRLALISGRTVDNPKLLTEAIKAGCSVIYLEKPGKLLSLLLMCYRLVEHMICVYCKDQNLF